MPLNLQFLNRMLGRRVRDRLERRLEAYIRVLDGEGGSGISASQAAKVVNLSEGGCCLAVPSLALPGFHLTRCLESPEVFPLEVQISAPGSGTWRLQAQVRWTNRDFQETGWSFRVGARFCGGQSLPANWRRLLAQESTGRDVGPLGWEGKA